MYVQTPPKCPGEHRGRYLTVLTLEQTESTAPGFRQTSKSRSDVRFGATSQGTAEHYAKKEHSLFTGFNGHSQQSKQGQQGAREIPLQTQCQPESSPRSPCCSRDSEDTRPDVPSHHLGKGERRWLSEANRHLEGLTLTERDHSTRKG